MKLQIVNILDIRQPYINSKTNLAYSTPLGLLLFCIRDDLSFYENNGNVFVIKGNEELVNSYICSDTEEARLSFTRQFGKLNMTYIDEKDLSFFQGYDLDVLEEEYEAIYPVSRFSVFEGIGKERNLAKKFFENFKSVELKESLIFTPECIKVIKYLNDKWAKRADCSEDLDLYLLNSVPIDFSVTDMKIYLVYIDSMPASYVIGCVGNNDVFVWLCSKADVEYRGIYQGTMSLVGKELEKCGILKINYTNLTCFESLRHMKMGLKPERFLKSYRLKENAR
jgi:hypothetical protein